MKMMKYLIKFRNELQYWIEKFNFDDNAKWCYLENDGKYKYYDDEYCFIIEQS